MLSISRRYWALRLALADSSETLKHAAFLGLGRRRIETLFHERLFHLGCIHDFHNGNVKTHDDLARHNSRRLRTARTRKRRYRVNCFTHGAYI